MVYSSCSWKQYWRLIPHPLRWSYCGPVVPWSGNESTSLLQCPGIDWAVWGRMLRCFEGHILALLEPVQSEEGKNRRSFLSLLTFHGSWGFLCELSEFSSACSLPLFSYPFPISKQWRRREKNKLKVGTVGSISTLPVPVSNAHYLHVAYCASSGCKQGLRGIRDIMWLIESKRLTVWLLWKKYMLPNPLFQRYKVTMRQPSVVGKCLAETSEHLTLIPETP